MHILLPHNPLHIIGILFAKDLINFFPLLVHNIKLTKNSATCVEIAASIVCTFSFLFYFFHTLTFKWCFYYYHSLYILEIFKHEHSNGAKTICKVYAFFNFFKAKTFEWFFFRNKHWIGVETISTAWTFSNFVGYENSNNVITISIIYAFSYFS